MTERQPTNPQTNCDHKSSPCQFVTGELKSKMDIFQLTLLTTLSYFPFISFKTNNIKEIKIAKFPQILSKGKKQFFLIISMKHF
jgi:hypothetical protein